MCCVLASLGFQTLLSHEKVLFSFAVLGFSAWTIFILCILLALQQTDDLSEVYPASCTMIAKIGSKSPATLNWILMDGWMDALLQ